MKAHYAPHLLALVIIGSGCSPESQVQYDALNLGTEAATFLDDVPLSISEADWHIIKNIELPLATYTSSFPMPAGIKSELTRAQADSAAIELFFSLARATDGEAYSAKHAGEVVNVISSIVNQHASAGSDIVFLIDKTGSMSDDIATLRNNLTYILDLLEHIPNVRLGMAFYSDLNVEENWFELVPLSPDFSQARDALNNIKSVGGGDSPESVNDGIARTVDEMNWQSESKRMILVLGDAPSQTGQRSRETLESVVQKCVDVNVKVNLFPVLIDIVKGNSSFIVNNGVWKANPGGSELVSRSGMILRVYPNPASDKAMVQMEEPGDYLIEMYTITGSKVVDDSFTGTSYEISCRGLAAGQYIVRVSSPDIKTFDGKNLIVQH